MTGANNPMELLSLLGNSTPSQLHAIMAILKGQPTPRQGPLLLNQAAAARMLGISRATLWRLTRAGKITKIELGPGTHRYRTDEVEALASRGALE